MFIRGGFDYSTMLDAYPDPNDNDATTIEKGHPFLFGIINRYITQMNQDRVSGMSLRLLLGKGDHFLFSCSYISYIHSYYMQENNLPEAC